MITRRGIATAVAVVAAAGAFAQNLPIQPGEWETRVTINSVDMPGAPPAVANMMRGRTTTVRHCITAADAAKGPQEMLKSSKSCAFTRYSMAGGKLSSQMVCKQGGGTMTATATGSYTATSFTGSGRTVTTGGPMPMTMTSTTAGRRIGACK